MPKDFLEVALGVKQGSSPETETQQEGSRHTWLTLEREGAEGCIEAQESEERQEAFVSSRKEEAVKHTEELSLHRMGRAEQLEISA